MTRPYNCDCCGVRVQGYRITISKRGRGGYRHNICMDCAKKDLIKILEDKNSKGKIEVEQKDIREKTVRI